MPYLGVTDGDNKGVYMFESISVAKGIAKNLEVKFYRNNQIQNALSDFNISEDEIKDGRILIQRVNEKNNKLIQGNSLLVITQTPYRGIYLYKSKAARKRVASHFGKTAVLVDSKEDALIVYSEVNYEYHDGGILFSPECREWRDKNSDAVSGNYFHYTNKQLVECVSSKKEKPKNEDIEVVKAEVKEAKNKESNKSSNFTKNALFELIKKYGEDYDLVRFNMSDGNSYFATLNDMYLVAPSFDMKNLLKGSKKDVADKISKWIKSGQISALSTTKMNFIENFILLIDADDLYSPNPRTNEKDITYFEHGISQILLNVSQIDSIYPTNDYNDMTWVNVSKEIRESLNN